MTGTGLTPLWVWPSLQFCTVLFIDTPQPQGVSPRLAGAQMEASLLLSTGAVRASSVFPILSVTLLFFGGLCVAASEFHRTRHSVILSAGIFFVSAGECLALRCNLTTNQSQSYTDGERSTCVQLRIPLDNERPRL